PSAPARPLQGANELLFSAQAQVKRRSAPGSSSLLPSYGSEVAVADQLVPLFIPETEGEGFETGEQCDGLHGLKQRLGLVALFQVIIRYPRAEMMDVMKPDVAREPLQYLGQFVERTALQRS